MFRPARLITILILTLVIYAAFFATPVGVRAEGNFDPDAVAAQEVEIWKAEKGHSDFSLYLGAIVMLREQERYSWFRAVQAGFYLGRAMNTFIDLHTRYERVLPDLEDAAQIQKDWMHATFDPAAVARAQLNWWVTRRMPNLNSVDSVSQLMAEEYGLRYHLGADRMMAAATLRTQALDERDEGGIDPPWPTISKRLAESYRALSTAIQLGRRRAEMADLVAGDSVPAANPK